jgi:Argonaute siRNA chaperone (ARC) complex subunit Arb1
MSGDTDEFAKAAAKDAVEEDVMSTSEVDFEWVIRGFLSNYFPFRYGWRNEEHIVITVLPLH